MIPDPTAPKPLQPTVSGTLPGWTGGFAQSKPAFAYPDPDLSSLHLFDNMSHIPLIKRQMAVRWPEFSWTRVIGDEGTRCFQMFAPYISRIGYTNEGRSYSIICPQQGTWLGDDVCLNVEVTVTGQRGWVDELGDDDKADSGTVAADLQVEPRIWLTLNPSASDKWKNIWHELSHWGGFPTTKANAILLHTHAAGNVDQPTFTLRKGMSPRYVSPPFTRHDGEAFTVAHLEVGIGEIHTTLNPLVNTFNHLLMDAFNVASGNMLANGNVLTWNVWFATPDYVCAQEWASNAERWRLSIDAHHGSPDGPSSKVRDTHGKVIPVSETAIKDILDELVKHLNSLHGYHFA